MKRGEVRARVCVCVLRAVSHLRGVICRRIAAHDGTKFGGKARGEDESIVRPDEKARSLSDYL